MSKAKDADVEMKDESGKKAVEEEKKEEPVDPFFEIKKNLVLLEKAAKEKDFKMCATLTKQFKKLRKLLSINDAVLLLDFYLPSLSQRLQLPQQATVVDNREERLHCNAARATEIMQYPEAQLFLYNLLLMKLIDDKDFKNAKEFGDFVYARIKDVNMRTMDHLTAKAIYMIGIAYERLNSLPLVRPFMFEAYKSCCLKLNLIGQATAVNVILRSYLSQHLYEQARNFIIKTNFPETASNNQYARYLYYLGRIKTVQLEYSEAQARLIQALRKGPEVGAKGFRVQCQKLLIIVNMLMGEIPSRQLFANKEYQKVLLPYYQVVLSVKQGDMEDFGKVLQKYASVFKADSNFTLISRLKHTVIKFGLKKINISYSKISLSDVCKKLALESIEETEQIVAKAIRDGVIEAVINHEESYMRTIGNVDVYTSNDPQQILHKRIQYCLDLHADAVRALEFPPKEDKRDFGDIDEERSTKEEDILASLMEDFGMDGGDF